MDAKALSERYVGVWMEADPSVRRRMIRELWAPDRAHVLEPPRDIRDAAKRLGFRTLGSRGQRLRGAGGEGDARSSSRRVSSCSGPGTMPLDFSMS
jgi:hypothetical protein